jgi:hypothetical protein
MFGKWIAAGAVALGVIALAGAADMQRPAQAWTSPQAWCAYFGSVNAQYSDCSYYTYEQCQATIFGVGGRCYANPTYAGPADDLPRRPRKKRHKS